MVFDLNDVAALKEEHKIKIKFVCLVWFKLGNGLLQRAREEKLIALGTADTHGSRHMLIGFQCDQ